MPRFVRSVVGWVSAVVAGVSVFILILIVTGVGPGWPRLPKQTSATVVSMDREIGIPHAFIVGTNGAVLWHGFPNENLDRTLQRIISGKFDLELAKNVETGDRLVAQYTAQARKPNAIAQVTPLGEKILADYSKDWRVPHHLAKVILTDPAVRSRDVALALRAAARATEMTRERFYDVLEMQARALFATGKKPEAVAMQKQALALCNDPEVRKDLEKFLALYEKGASAPPSADRSAPAAIEQAKQR